MPTECVRAWLDIARELVAIGDGCSDVIGTARFVQGRRFDHEPTGTCSTPSLLRRWMGKADSVASSKRVAQG
jgi:hypothetical protein